MNTFIKVCSTALCVIAMNSAHSAPLSQSELNKIANTLDIKYSVFSNHDHTNCASFKGDNACFKGNIELHSTEQIDQQDWVIYFSHLQPIYQDDSPFFDITHINGDLHKLQPTEAFTALSANQTHHINFTARLWHLAHSDVQPNYYITSGELKAQVIKSTAPIIDPETQLTKLPHLKHLANGNLKRNASDKTSKITPQARYEHNQKLAITDDKLVPLIPSPYTAKLDTGAGAISVKEGFNIGGLNLSEASLTVLKQRLSQLNMTVSNKHGLPIISEIDKKLSDNPEYYQLQTSHSGIEIKAVNETGIFYALQSVVNLIDHTNKTLPAITIKDKPRYPHRGMLIDVARNFSDKEFILKLLDQMAAYKLNFLHLHLSDDEGWRIEIASLPELTQFGAYRCHSTKEQDCLLPQLGHGPSKQNPASGYYTQQDFIDILQAAKARNITVMPMIVMPAHARAAVQSMEKRYRDYMAIGDIAKAEQYRLIDPHNTSQYETVQYYSDNSINPCLDASYEFVETVVTDIAKLYKSAGVPLTHFHIGADETEKAWVNSPACKALNDNNIDLVGHFITKVAGILNKQGITLGAWSDGLHKTDLTKLKGKVLGNSWEHLPWAGTTLTNHLINNDVNLVLSTPDSLYFDAPYEPHQDERGFYWSSRQTDTFKVFSTMPDNLPAMAEIWTTRNGHPFTVNDTKHFNKDINMAHSPRLKNRLLTGIQGHLWSETTHTDNHKAYMIYPRLLALAERAWHRAPWELKYDHAGREYSATSNYIGPLKKAALAEDYGRFSQKLGSNYLAKLELEQVFFRLPPPGAKVIKGKVHANVHYRGLPIEYKLGDGPWLLYQHPFDLTDVVELRSTTHSGKRKSRSVYIENQAQ